MVRLFVGLIDGCYTALVIQSGGGVLDLHTVWCTWVSLAHAAQWFPDSWAAKCHKSQPVVSH